MAQRVKQGGHHVPDKDIVRRYYTGLKHLLTHYLPLADNVLVMDNSSEESLKRLVARKNINSELEILDKMVWEKIKKVIHE